MVSHSFRLKEYVLDAREAFKRTGCTVPDAEPISTDGNQSVDAAYTPWVAHNEDAIARVLGQTADGGKARRLKDALGFLGKLGKSFSTFVRTAEKLPGFDNLSITPINMGKTVSTKLKRKDQGKGDDSL